MRPAGLAGRCHVHRLTRIELRPEIVLADTERARPTEDRLAHLVEVTVPAEPTSDRRRAPIVPTTAPDFVQRVTATMMARRGDELPVSVFAPDGTATEGPPAEAKQRLRRYGLELRDGALFVRLPKATRF